MRYFGGKSRLARELSGIINKFQVKSYHEPFCGVFSVGSLVAAPQRTASDTQSDLILLLQAVQNGWEGPESISEDEYNNLKQMEPSALRAFVGFGCSNSGKFFGGYARESTSRNFALNARASLLTLAPRIEGVQFSCQAYLDFNSPVELIYCDPPYTGTTGFTSGAFDTSEFWRWVREYSRRSIILVSEYTAPEWATVLWQKSVRTDMNAKGGGKLPRIEKLFTVGT